MQIWSFTHLHTQMLKFEFHNKFFAPKIETTSDEQQIMQVLRTNKLLHLRWGGCNIFKVTKIPVNINKVISLCCSKCLPFGGSFGAWTISHYAFTHLHNEWLSSDCQYSLADLVTRCLLVIFLAEISTVGTLPCFKSRHVLRLKSATYNAMQKNSLIK